MLIPEAPLFVVTKLLNSSISAMMLTANNSLVNAPNISYNAVIIYLIHVS